MAEATENTVSPTDVSTAWGTSRRQGMALPTSIHGVNSHRAHDVAIVTDKATAPSKTSTTAGWADQNTEKAASHASPHLLPLMPSGGSRQASTYRRWRARVNERAEMTSSRPPVTLTLS